MGLNQFAVYQLKNTPENREKRFRPYQMLQEKGIKVWYKDYEQVYFGRMQEADTPEGIRERFDKQLPRTWKGHSVSVGDVFVFNKEGVVTSYYVEKTGLTRITGFIPDVSHGAPVSLNTTGFSVEGKEGSWLAFDSDVIDGRPFFLMEHEKYGRDVAWVVVDEKGKLIVDNVYNGFDQPVKQRIKDYINPPQHVREPVKQEKPASASNQKDKEHGGQSCGSGVEGEPKSIHNPTGGRPKPVLPKGKNGRTSVLAKLHQKQAEIAKRNGKPAP